MLRFTVFVVACQWAMIGKAQDPFIAGYFSLSAPVITEISDIVVAKTPLRQEAKDQNPPSFFNGIVNIGKSIWQIVDAGRPVANVTYDYANALPEDNLHWHTFAGWQAPIAKTFEVTYTNMFNITVVRFRYRVLYTYGGSFQGVGKYLLDIKTVPAEVDVGWGFTFTATARVPHVANAGTPEDPIATAELLVEWKIYNPLQATIGSASYYIRGDGPFQDLTEGV